MNNFDGILVKYPEICIDNFLKSIILNKSIKIFILTHFHDDHMHGLEDLEFYKHLKNNKDKIKFLVSKITHQFIETCDKYKHLSEFCTQLVSDVPINLELNQNESVTLTFYGSGHCPGSVMAFVEGNRGNILFTGDFRLPLNSAPRLKFLNKVDHYKHNNEDVKRKQIDYLYIDATFFKQAIKDLPTREESVDELIKYLKRIYGNDDKNESKTYVYLKTSARIGYEYVYQEIYRNLKYKIHVNDTIYNLYDSLPQIQSVLTLDPYETPIHSCMYEMKKRDLKRGVLFTSTKKVNKPSNGFDLPCTCLNYDQTKSPITTIKIILSTMWFVDTQGIEKLLVNYIPTKNEITTTSYKPYKLIYRLLYSFHSSFNEIVDFVKCLKPANLKIIALPESVSEREINEYFYGSSKNNNNKANCLTQTETCKNVKLLLKKRKSCLNMKDESSDGESDRVSSDDDDGFNFGDNLRKKRKSCCI